MFPPPPPPSPACPGSVGLFNFLFFSTIVTWWTLFFFVSFGQKRLDRSCFISFHFDNMTWWIFLFFFSFWQHDLKWIFPQFCFATLPSILPVLDNFCIIDESSWGKVVLRYKSQTLLRTWHLIRCQQKMSGRAWNGIVMRKLLMLSNCCIYACWRKTHSDVLISLYQTWD